MKPLDAKLYQQVCDLLFDEWDPIGVNAMGGTRDEYDSYAPKLIRMIRDGADLYQVAEYLGRSAHESMELSHVHAQRDQQVALRLIMLIRGE